MSADARPPGSSEHRMAGDPIVWRLHLRADPGAVFGAIDSAEGRAHFWAEEAPEVDGIIEFRFIDGTRHLGRVLDRTPPHRWSIDYFGSVATFELEPDGRGGTDLMLTDVGVHPDDREEVLPGWLNVLLPLKAWVDHGIDLRNHDPERTWRQRYVDQ